MTVVARMVVIVGHLGVVDNAVGKVGPCDRVPVGDRLVEPRLVVATVEDRRDGEVVGQWLVATERLLADRTQIAHIDHWNERQKTVPLR